MKQMKKWPELSKREKIERWQQVLRVLRELTPHERRRHFNMSFFGQKNECGTVACAAGHCGLDPWFRRRGFQLNFYIAGYDDYSSKPIFDDRVSSVTDFFGTDGADEIFFNSAIRPVGTVIREVLNYIKSLEKE